MIGAAIMLLFGLLGGGTAWMVSRDPALVTPFGVLTATVGFVCVVFSQAF